ncbi:MAG: hypothetical protein ACKOU6_06635 [Planctomycetota bacterium]
MIRMPTLDSSSIRCWSKVQRLVLLLCSLSLVTACTSRSQNGQAVISVLNLEAQESVQPWTPTEVARIEQQVESFCGNCHATPRPDIFPRDAWPEEISAGLDCTLNPVVPI